MRSWLLTCSLLLAGTAALGEEDILGVLARSQQTQIDGTTLADPDGPRARVVRASFDTLVRTLGMEQRAELRVIEGNTVADAMQGHVVMVNASLAALGEGERLFILAHELGHIALGHWAQTQQVYLKWVPGAVTQERTDAIADRLGREASSLSHRQEFEADAFALQTLHTLGRTQRDALSAFVQLGNRGSTVTHPSTGQRLASLRAAEAEWLRAAQLADARREVSSPLGTTPSSP